jgi:sigma-B regulation protein RsbU (phosphoserine phosphatase)
MSVTDLVAVAIGSMLLALGTAAIFAWGVRTKASDRLLLYFGIWCGLYGLRLLALQTTVRMAFGGPLRAWIYTSVFVTYIINVPGGLFIEGLVGTGWKHSVRRMWQAQALYAVVAVAVDLATGRPAAAMAPNSAIVLAGVIVWLANLWVYRDRLPPLFKSPAIAIGATVFILFVINQNIGRPLIPSTNVEPVGVFIFLVCLGYAIVGSVFAREAALVAVNRELETARQIQVALLPRDLPHLSHVDLAVRYLPMTAVAGDLYDFAVLDPGRVGVLVADVAGHGVPAALVASMVKVAFTSQSANAHDPATMLTGMNKTLCGHLEGSFVTAIYAVISGETLVYANAGHPSLLVGRSDGRVDSADERGCMLGVFPGAIYANGRVDVLPGDHLLLYTDGVTEAQNPFGEFVDEHRVRDWLTSSRDENASTVADSLLQRLRSWHGVGAFDDDVTFVVARIART